MNLTTFFWVGCVAGIGLFATVAWRWLSRDRLANPLVAITFVLLGFILVSSPVWGSIIVKGPQWEISLYRDAFEQEAKACKTLLESVVEAIPLEQYPELRDHLSEIEKLRNQRDEAIELRNREQAQVSIMQIQATTDAVLQIVKRISSLSP